MRSLHLTLVIFVQLLLASFLLYTNLVSASPLNQDVSQQQQVASPPSHVPIAPVVAEPQLQAAPVVVPQQAQQQVEHHKVSKPVVSVVVEPQIVVHHAPAPIQRQVVNQEAQRSLVESVREQAAVVRLQDRGLKRDRSRVAEPLEPKSVSIVSEEQSAKLVMPISKELSEEAKPKDETMTKARSAAVQKEASVVELRPFQGQVEKVSPYYEIEKKSQPAVTKPVAVEPVVPVPVVQEGLGVQTVQAVQQQAPPQQVEQQEQQRRSEPKSVSASATLTVQSPEPKVIVVGRVEQSPVNEPQQQQTVAPVVVNGGLGPLHLLAATLCSYQPDKPVADEIQNHLYNQRAAVRKSLFDFMSLKFTNLEKFSSRLNSGLEIMPRKTTDSNNKQQYNSQQQQQPSHGWPVVGKCTAHDLKLMAEAAWCEAPSRAGSGRALADDQSAVISKILHVSDPKEVPNVERTIAQLNLTQQQLAELQAQASSTRLCRRNALRLTKALFNHLAEDQKSQSDSWPQLYAQMSEDDCARRRMIDIVNALSGFRSDSTNIRRDNVEFAFAMDDLRAKVLESEVNVPLVFDKQFIEVEQFLQQSVKLMLSNIDPERAKLTSMRYRSLMPQPVSADDQCIELHQRLLAKNYPTDCNPNQFGQLPDVLRMAASSLELWSIETELSKRPAVQQQQEYSNSPASSNTKREVNECIANLVAS